MKIGNEDLPKVAIIGRPNVGKSTLFNILTDSRKAIVKNQPGVTRDLQIQPVEVWGKNFDLIDTGGLTELEDLFSKLIWEQVTEFIRVVDFLLIVVDGREGMHPEDRNLIKLAKQTQKDFLVIVNKVDRAHEEEMLKAEFYEFGDNVIAASFEQRRGLDLILEKLHKILPENTVTETAPLRLAIVGKPNAGKSSLCNQLLGMNRMMVSPIAGTTIDAIETELRRDGHVYRLVDTAGLRKSSKREELEIIAAFKAQEGLRRADLVMLVVDALIGPTEQDAKIMASILEDHKGVILIANKIDLAQKEIPAFRKTFQEQIAVNFHFFPDVPVVYLSSLTGSGVEDLFTEINRVADKINFRISTSKLNDFFFKAIRGAPSPVHGTKNVKFYYVTQTFQKPPAFIAFANHPDGVTASYRRFLIKQMKEEWDLQGIPIRIFCMKSRRSYQNESER